MESKQIDESAGFYSESRALFFRAPRPPLFYAAPVPDPAPNSRDSVLVRVTHWFTVIAFLALLVTGLKIVISHPRFYRGETGNVNMRPLFTIPIASSRDTVPTGYNYVMPDQNGWSRYLRRACGSPANSATRASNSSPA